MDDVADIGRRFQERFNVEIVERFSLCPWAAPARRAGEVLVVGSDVGDIARVAAAARAELERVSDVVELVQVVFPLVGIDWSEWERLLSHAVQNNLFDVERWAGAAFHPGFPVRLDRPGARVRLLRKSPDPSWQFIARRSMPKSADTKFVSQEDIASGAWSQQGPSVRKDVTDEIRAKNDQLLLGDNSAELVEAIEALIRERGEASHLR